MSTTKSESVTKQIEHIAEEICDKYCKYPGEYKDPNKLYEEKCENCPLMRLI